MLFFIIIYQFRILNFGHWNLLFGIYPNLLQFLNLLAVLTNMRTSLPDDDPLKGRFTAGAGQIRPSKYLQ